MLTREQDYAFGRPAMTRNKVRKLELLAGAPPQKGRHGIAGGKSKAVFDAERELSRQAEAAYRRLVNDWHATRPATVGAGATPGRAHLKRPRRAKPRGRLSSPETCASSVARTHPKLSQRRPQPSRQLDFHPSLMTACTGPQPCSRIHAAARRSVAETVYWFSAAWISQ
jgi:hypothetical protein